MSSRVSGSGGARFPEVAPLVEVWRGDVVESRHRGGIAVVDAAGRLTRRVGDARLFTFWRSSSKPLQALPAVLTGAADRYGLEPRHLAVMCGSHVGKDYHVAVVREILERARIPEAALHCDRPGRPLARHGCSGKHAGMLVTARHLGEPLEGYTEPDHPVQRRIRDVLGRLADVAAEEIPLASDGCSVPTFAMALDRMALAFARLVDPVGLPEDLAAACRQIVAAMWARPDLLSGAAGDTSDITSALVQAKAGVLVAKSGAESLYCVGVAPGVLGPRGVGLAVRAEDGGSVQRSCYLATAEALRQLGCLSDPEIELLGSYLGREVRNVHGRVVGHARPCFELRSGEGE
ncbi:MAG TPA: asparaginase [Chloroflexota bacterium]|nr:asparaginase [Chloroflexota bacterium]